ncbi:MAG: hypothetical protein JWM86_1168 [Thermoleophilia bacterium]|nr:hypothetical protein [Thermoleophilia bacterium]
MSVSPISTPRLPLAAVDAERVQVAIAGPGGRRTAVGSAAAALRDRRLTAAERAAIRALVRAVELLRERAQLAGIDDAGTGVTLVLRDGDASKRGPWATVGTVSVGTRNALAGRSSVPARADALLTVDAAVHELVHVVQFATMPEGATPHAGILEGIADAAAILATGDDLLGEDFFVRDAAGRPRGAIRDVGSARSGVKTLGHVVTDYAAATRAGVEEHAAGGVVTATFIALRDQVGRERAEQLLWLVIRDRAAWQQGGSWRSLAEAIRRGAAQLNDPALNAAADVALARTGLAAALRA